MTRIWGPRKLDVGAGGGDRPQGLNATDMGTQETLPSSTDLGSQGIKGVDPEAPGTAL